ncbi:MAG: type I-E CRISPR-associated protein Cse1/CasA [Ferrimonas sp.]
MVNQYNLIDEPWVPVTGHTMVSLKQLFADPQLPALAGNPIQKIAITKLLLAIAQSAVTPTDDNDWQQLGWQGMAERCLAYLAQWHSRFYLYGEQPFLQFPSIAAAKIQPFGALSPEISSGNTTVLTQTQRKTHYSDAEAAMVLIVQMALGLAGKKTDNSVVLSTGYQNKSNDKGKPASGKAGPAVCYMGLLHSFWQGSSIVESIWLNLFTQQDLQASSMYGTLGQAPWERMPTGEDDDIARALRESLIGRLVPLSKFCLLAEGGMHYTDGIAHADYLNGRADPSVAIDFSQKKPKALWVDPNKRPWRELTSLLQFLEQGKSNGFDTPQLRCSVGRISKMDGIFAVWSGGLRVSSNAGEQYVSGTDNYVDSLLELDSELLNSAFWEILKQEMLHLDKLQKNLWSAVVRYYRELSDIDKSGTGKAQTFVDEQAKRASGLFWQQCERHAQQLIDASGTGQEAETKRRELRKRFSHYLLFIFDAQCPRNSVRQLDAWAQNRPQPLFFGTSKHNNAE